MNDKPWIEALGDLVPEVHPSAFVHRSAVIIGDVTVGAGCSIWPNTTLRGDDGRIVLGERCSVQDGTVIHMTSGMSDAWVGDQVTIGHNVTLHGAKVGSNCIIGMGSVVLDNAEIGDWSIVGAGALVTMNKKFPPGSLILGSPAKAVRQLTDKDREWIEHSWKRYMEQSARYKAQG
jgi:carbonic anhydrase/acetyltransferase-like protein (isoleucine patch superfamily)